MDRLPTIEAIRARLERIGMCATGPDAFDHPVIWLAKVYAGRVGNEVPTIDASGQSIIKIVPATLELRARCAEAVARFLEPTLKSLEVKGEIEHKIPPVVDYANLPVLALPARPSAAPAMRMKRGANGSNGNGKHAPRPA